MHKFKVGDLVIRSYTFGPFTKGLVGRVTEVEPDGTLRQVTYFNGTFQRGPAPDALDPYTPPVGTKVRFTVKCPVGWFFGPHKKGMTEGVIKSVNYPGVYKYRITVGASGDLGGVSDEHIEPILYANQMEDTKPVEKPEAKPLPKVGDKVRVITLRHTKNQYLDEGVVKSVTTDGYLPYRVDFTVPYATKKQSGSSNIYSAEDLLIIDRFTEEEIAEPAPKATSTHNKKVDLSDTFWIVVLLNKDHTLAPSATPVVHAKYAEAMTEARRLTELHGETFIVMKAISTLPPEKVTKTITTTAVKTTYL